MKIIVNIASFISKREIIQVIKNFDSTLYKNDLFFIFNHIDRLDTRAQVIMSLLITDKTIVQRFLWRTQSCDTIVICMKAGRNGCAEFV
jgi:hypothetical protein